MPDQQAPRLEAGVEYPAPPAKRQKRAANEESPNDSHTTKKGKACSICRKLKIKCDAGERGMGSCSRCRRLNLTCLSEKRSWTNAEGDEYQTHQLVLGKLEMALSDVLAKLGLPALDLYVHPAIVGSQRTERPTRANSEDRDDEREVSPGPMNSLIEATQLNGLRSQLRSIKQRRAGGMRRMHSDLIAEKLIDHREAEEMLDLFKLRLSQHMFSATIPAEANLEGIRTSSTVLFTAIILVTALHIPGREQLHERCHARFLGLVSAMMFDKFHTLDDIRGLCIAAFWQPDLSWKLSGLGVRMATELNLHYAFHEAFHPDTSEDERNDCLEKARLWYLLYVLDHQSSITYGRPSTMAELRPIKDYGFLLNSQWLLPSDRGLLAQVAGFSVLNKAFEMFGLEPKRTMSGDDITILNHQRFTDDVVAWREKWVRPKTNGSFAADYLARGVELHYHFSNLVLNSMVLRGRPMHKLSEMPSSLRPLALKAIESAHAILQHFVDEPGYREDLVGMPLHLHSVIAFATVFLLKMSYRWHAIGITIDASQRTIPLIESIINMLRESRAGANHIVFSMATGFDRMLTQLRKRHAASIKAKELSDLPLDATADHPNNTKAGSGLSAAPAGLYPDNLDASVAPYRAKEELPEPLDIPSISPPGSFTNWGFQDDDLWFVGMGYDLLQPGGQSFTNPNHNSQDFTDMPPMS